MRRRTLLAQLGTVAAVGAVAGCLDDGADPGAGGGDEDGGDGDGNVNETDGADGDGNETDGGEGVDDGDENESDGDDDTGNETDEGTDGTGDDGDEDETGGDEDGSDGDGSDDESGDDETHAGSGSGSGSFDGGRYSLRTTETACGETDEATVEVEGETIAVTGQIQTPDPCYDAVLSRANASGDELEIHVGVESTGGACQQCLGTVAYEATFEFDDGMPATVSVWHESHDTTREVASTSTD